MRNSIKIIYKSLTRAFFKYLYGNITIGNNLKLISKFEIKDKFFQKKKYFIYSIINGVVYTDNVQNVAVISNNKLHVKSSFHHGNDKIVSATNDPTLKNGLTNFRKKYYGNVLSLVQGASTENYFHWLMDILPKIRIYSSAFSIKKIDFFI